MRKFLLGLFLGAFTASFSLAATIEWGATNVPFYGPTGSPIDGGSAFLFLVDTTSASTPTFSGEWNLNNSVLVATSSTQGGGFDSQSLNIDYDTLYKPNPNGTENSFFYVVVITTESGSTLSDITNGWYYVSDLAFLEDGGSLNPDDPSDSTGSIWFAGDGTSGWQEMKAIPEPTALALLALGVAGLALRRRCA